MGGKPNSATAPDRPAMRTLFRWVMRGLLVGFAAAVLYLSLLALQPRLREVLPAWLGWFGEPGSIVTVAVTLALPAAYLLIRTKLLDEARPAIVGGVVIAGASAVLLGMGGYWKCHEAQTPFFAPLSWTLGLFVGNFERVYQPADRVGSCADLAMPIGLELARLLAILTTLTTAFAAAMVLFHSQIDRLRIRLARALVVVVGLDEDSVSLLRAVSESLSSRQTLVVLTGDSNREVARTTRRLGARVREIDLDDAEQLGRLAYWRRLDRLYLLSENPSRNLDRFRVIDEQIAKSQENRRRLPLTVRIDDPWQAEVWRRSFLSNSANRWVADAVGCFEITAGRILRHVLRHQGTAPTQTLILCGTLPLTYALTSEIAQLDRELEVYPRPDRDMPDRVVIFGDDAASFVEDHNFRQARIAVDRGNVPLIAEPATPTVDSISAYLEREGFVGRCVAVILTDPLAESHSFGTRLAMRFPELKIYQVASGSVSLANFSSSIVGHLFAFSISMELEAGAPQDAWERAAELVHERYSSGTERDTPATVEWPSLGDFYKGSNRRVVANTLWMIEEKTDLTWNSLECPPQKPLPAGFDDLSVGDQLGVLGLRPETVEELLELEHQDWCRYHYAAGWKYDPVRSDKDKRHNRLRDWQELIRDKERGAESREKARKNLCDTLMTLRSLGYIAVPMHVETESDTVR